MKKYVIIVAGGKGFANGKWSSPNNSFPTVINLCWCIPWGVSGDMTRHFKSYWCFRRSNKVSGKQLCDEHHFAKTCPCRRRWNTFPFRKERAGTGARARIGCVECACLHTVEVIRRCYELAEAKSSDSCGGCSRDASPFDRCRKWNSL